VTIVSTPVRTGSPTGSSNHCRHRPQRSRDGEIQREPTHGRAQQEREEREAGESHRQALAVAGTGIGEHFVQLRIEAERRRLVCVVEETWNADRHAGKERGEPRQERGRLNGNGGRQAIPVPERQQRRRHPREEPHDAAGGHAVILARRDQIRSRHDD
jgi:hypothetical protein